MIYQRGFTSTARATARIVVRAHLLYYPARQSPEVIMRREGNGVGRTGPVGPIEVPVPYGCGTVGPGPSGGHTVPSGNHTVPSGPDTRIPGPDTVPSGNGTVPSAW